MKPFVVFAVMLAVSAATLPPTSTVFTPGEAGYAAFRIPGVASLQHTLLVFAEGRKFGCDDFAGQHDVVYKRSTDNGQSWSPLRTLLNPAKQFGHIQCPTSGVKSENGARAFFHVALLESTARTQLARSLQMSSSAGTF